MTSKDVMDWLESIEISIVPKKNEPFETLVSATLDGDDELSLGVYRTMKSDGGVVIRYSKNETKEFFASYKGLMALAGGMGLIDIEEQENG